MDRILLTAYLKEQGAVKASKVEGANGQFISAVKADGSVFTMPVGKRSYSASIKEMNVLITDTGVAIATANTYDTLETVEL